MRITHDSLGEVAVADDVLWQAQTQRSLENFPIGSELMPPELIRALLLIKKSAAHVNARLGVLDADYAKLIEAACDELLAGEYMQHFPLKVWQTGSGTQTNMNVNEVVATRANELGRQREVLDGQLIHPNDHVNRSQSSNDVFPSAMHLAALTMLHDRLYPACERLASTLEDLEHKYEGVIKSGRTHLMDAVPIAFSQELYGWRGLVEQALALVRAQEKALCSLAIGGTAVGTGLNAPDGFAEAVAADLSHTLGLELMSSPNKFHALTSKDALVASHGAIKALAANLMKLAGDVRWLASGPRTGLGEVSIPANEPGSSIMPGKVNPTQAEALTMVCVQVMGNDATLGFAASQGNFELNVYMPVIAYNYLQSVGLLADAMDSFGKRCLVGLVANEQVMQQNLERSLMSVTALTPALGYERAAQVAQCAHAEGLSIKESVLRLGFMTEDEFDAAWNPRDMV